MQLGVQVPARPLPLLRLAIFTLLFLLWLLPAMRVGTLVHELGHVFSYRMCGGYGYAVFINPLPHPPQGLALGDVQYKSSSTQLVASLSGTSTEALFGLLLLLLIAKLPPRSTFRFFIGLCAGSSFLMFLWYPLYSYYGGWGDFSDWPELFGTWGRWLMPLLFLVCLPLGYAVGGWFFRTVDAWLPASSWQQRILQSLLAVGILYAAASMLMIIHFGILPPTLGMLLTGSGALFALYRMPASPAAAPPRLSRSAIFFPACLVVGIESLLFAIGGYIPIPIPASALPPPSPIPYTDTKIASLPAMGRLATDHQGHLYFNAGNQILYRYSLAENRLDKLCQADHDYWFWEKYHDQKAYMIRSEKPAPGADPAYAIAALDLETQRFETLLRSDTKLHSGLDVNERGDVFFAQSGRLLRLPAGAAQPVPIRDAPAKIMWIRAAPDGWIYLFLLPEDWGPQSLECSLARVSPDGKTSQTLATGLRYSSPFDVDPAGNIVLAGGPSVMQLSPPDYRPHRLGGLGMCASALYLPDGRVAYVSHRNKKIQLRLLTPIIPMPISNNYEY